MRLANGKPTAIFLDLPILVKIMILDLSGLNDRLQLLQKSFTLLILCCNSYNK